MTALLLGACTTPPNRGYTQTRADATPFAEAYAACWERGMGTPTAATGADVLRMSIHDACKRENGWEDRRSLF
jgi:hypothetical protein